MGDFVTQEECEDYREEYGRKLTDVCTRVVVLETNLQQITGLLKMILSSTIGGVVTIAIILLTRGI